jgi:hypothetical protein
MTIKGRLRSAPQILWQCLLAAGSFFLVFLWIVVLANARDLGQWGGQDSAIRDWFHSLMMPDHPMASCCGSADAYWADSFEVKGNQYVAIVTDMRPDGPLHRQHIEPGTRFLIPNNKITSGKENPTGHGWIFVLAGIVYCYLPPGGV